MGHIAVILMIRHSNINNTQKVETRTDMLEDDYDETLINWIARNLETYFKEANIDYDYDNYDDFIKQNYPYDDDESSPPFRVSYFDLRQYKWKYLTDEFIYEILNNWDDLDYIDFDDNDTYID
jgi:hypothetical protein